MLILLHCEAASLTLFRTMYPWEQQTSYNLIVKKTVLSFKYLINAALVVSLGDGQTIYMQLRKNQHLLDNWYYKQIIIHDDIL